MRSSLKSRLVDTALTVGAIAGVLCIALTIAAMVFGVRPMIFETDSMAPTVPVGSLALSKTAQANDIHKGDVVTVTRADGARITHRVVSVDGVVGNSATLTLQGDANSAPDHQKYVVTEVRRTVATVPVLGYVASWLSNPLTVVLEFLAVLALLAVAFAPKQGWRRTPGAHRLVAGTAAVTVVALAGTGVSGSGSASAAPLTGSADAVGTVIAGRPDNPTSLTCTDSGFLLYGKATLRWPNAEPAGQRGRYSYVLKSGNGIVGEIGPSQADELTFVFQAGLIQSVINLLFSSGGVVTLYQRVGNFESSSGLTQTINVSLVPLGFQCATTGTVRNRAAASVPPTSSDSSSPSPSSSDVTSSSTPNSTTSSSTPAPSTTQASVAPTLPAGGTSNASDTFAYYRDGSRVTIRDAKTTDVVYRGSYSSAATIRWLPGTETLEITEPDGTVTVVSPQGDRWVEDVTPPPAPEPEPATAEPESAPTTEPATVPSETAVPTA